MGDYFAAVSGPEDLLQTWPEALIVRRREGKKASKIFFLSYPLGCLGSLSSQGKTPGALATQARDCRQMSARDIRRYFMIFLGYCADCDR